MSETYPEFCPYFDKEYHAIHNHWIAAYRTSCFSLFNTNNGTERLFRSRHESFWRIDEMLRNISTYFIELSVVNELMLSILMIHPVNSSVVRVE